MDEQNIETTRPVNTRRRKRSKIQIFKEAYLPVIIAGLAVILVFIFVIGSITRGVQKSRYNKQLSLEASIAEEEEKARLALEAQELITRAEALAKSYDYDAAIQALDSFSGNIEDYIDLADTKAMLEHEKSQLVEWSDPNQIVNLSFQLLIADPVRAFNNPTYSYSFDKNFITTGEFYKILQQLYENGYILVSRDDFITTTTDADGNTAYEPKSIFLPNGKKPIMLTQTNVNYNIYLVDSDGDKLPDKDGGGFAHKLSHSVTANTFVNEMIDSEGQTVTGAYDLVPILEEFIAQNPSFSYKGARATLALTGYNGLFGYRTNAGAADIFGEDAYNIAVGEAQILADALRNAGYDLAFYTYENINYGESSTAQIQADLDRWTSEAVPIIGSLDTLVYAQQTDISTEQVYSGDKFSTLHNAGYRYYMGFCEDGKPWIYFGGNYIHQGRIMVTGDSLRNHADWFANLFDATMILDSSRG